MKIRDTIPCLFLLIVVAVGLFFGIAEIARAITWIKWAIQ